MEELWILVAFILAGIGTVWSVVEKSFLMAMLLGSLAFFELFFLVQTTLFN